MRAAYLLLKFTLKFSLWVYYPRTRMINAPKKRFSRTIFVCNHAASFMDPLVIAGNQKPIVFFMTRSDVFKGILKPVLWAAHMLPIYRSLDGEDTKKKNEEVFAKCNRILKNGKNLMIFAEGFTDDVFIRRLKPIKKGAARIGFGALEACNWEEKIYLQASGNNYTDPNTIGSSLVISNSDKVCLNDYKAEYLENPNKVITDITKKMELLLREQLTDVRNADWAPFHENVMQLTRKGMNAEDYNKEIPLLDRLEYSKQLASWLNKQDLKNPELLALKKKTDTYFGLLKRSKLKEKYMHYKSSSNETKTNDLVYMMLTFPLMIIGLIHCLLPYLFVKRFVEKVMKRRVFWGSVKMMMGHAIFGIYNITLLLLINYLVCQNNAVWIAYFFIVPMLSGITAYTWFKKFNDYKTKKALDKQDVSKLSKLRKDCIESIYRTIPVA